MKFFFTNLILLIFLWLSSPGVLSALDEQPTRPPDYLRQLQLFTIAESYCQDRLAYERLDETTRVQLTLELALTYGQHAAVTTGDSSREYWQQAETLLEQLGAGTESPGIRLLANNRLVELKIKQGKQSFRKWQLTKSPEDQTVALNQLTSAISFANELLKTSSHWTETRNEIRNSAKQSPLARAETLQLYRQLHISLTRPYLLRAKLHQDKPDDHQHDLKAAWTLLTKLSPRNLNSSMKFQSALLKAEIALEEQDFLKARQHLTGFDRENLNRQQQEQLLVSRVRFLIASGKMTEASKLLSKDRKQGHQHIGELRYLSILTLIEAARVALENNEETLASHVTQRAEADLSEFRVQEPGYWYLRSQHLFEQLSKQRQLGPTLVTLIETATKQYQAGDLENALLSYRSIIKSARASGQTETGVQNSFTLASIYLNQSKFKQAADTFRQLEQDFPESKRIAEAQIMQAYSLGQQLRQPELPDSPRQDLSRRLQNLLQKHRQEFQKSPTFVTATEMLISLAEQQEDLETAINLNFELLPIEPDKSTPLNRLLRLYPTLLAQLDTSPDRKLQFIQTGIDQLTRELKPPVTTNYTAQALIRAALSLLYLETSPPRHAEAAKILIPAINNPEWTKPTSQSVQKIISPLYFRILTQSQENPVKDFPNEFTQLATLFLNGTPDQLLELYESLASQSTSAPAQFKPVMKLILNKLHQSPEELTSRQQTRLQIAVLKQNIASDSLDAIVTQATDLLANPEISKIQLHEVASLLVQRSDPVILNAAVGYWKKLEQLDPPGTDPWFEARWHQADILMKSGDKKSGQRLTRRTLLLHKIPVSSKWNQKFKQLADPR